MPQPHEVDLVYNTSRPGDLEDLSHKANASPSVVALHTSAATGRTSKDSFQSQE